MWISVDDRLPEAYVDCLVWPHPNDDLNIITAAYSSEKKVWVQDFYNGYDYEDAYISYITHWMPLPEPPQDDKE